MGRCRYCRKICEGVWHKIGHDECNRREKNKLCIYCAAEARWNELTCNECFYNGKFTGYLCAV